MASEESLVHQGHRQRMRAKLSSHGARIFDTYELLEMLLYYVIPYKDTNPIAKGLLSAFGTLEGVLSAPKEELVKISGIGERAAELIILAGKFPLMHELSISADKTPIFDNYDTVGRYFVKHFESNSEHKTVAMLLDNSMRLISTERIPVENFGTAAVKPKFFIDAVARTGAGVMILCTQHKYGPLFPTDSEMQTSRLVRSELAKIGVQVAEYYIVSGKSFIGMSEGIATRLSALSPELARFYDSIGGGVYTVD